MRPVHTISLECIDSTNNYIKQNIAQFSEDKIYCVTAQEQTAGRGRFSKTWISPKGENIYATLYFTVDKAYPYLQNLSEVLAISCARVLHTHSIPAKIKWPNDILVHKKKMAGILTETLSLSEKIGVLLGIGVNVNLSEETLQKISQPATSYHRETGKHYDVPLLWKEIQSQFLLDLETLEAKGFSSFSQFYTQNLALQNETIRVSHGGKIVEGVCKEITETGTLILLDANQNRIEISTGELLQED